jgi:hypothetical protein
MHSIANPSAKHQPKDRDSRIIQAAIVKILTAKPGTGRQMIATGLSRAFDSSIIHAQMRAMLAAGEMVEQVEPRFGPRCYLAHQPRPIGEVQEITSGAVVSRFDPSVKAVIDKPIAEARSDRLKGDGPLLDQPSRRGRIGRTKIEVRRRCLTNVEAAIAASSQRIERLERERSTLIQSAGIRIDRIAPGPLREIATDRLAADLRNIDRVLKDTRSQLQSQRDRKASIEGGAS